MYLSDVIFWLVSYCYLLSILICNCLRDVIEVFVVAQIIFSGFCYFIHSDMCYRVVFLFIYKRNLVSY